MAATPPSSNSKQAHSSILGVDLGRSATKMVSAKNGKEGLSISQVHIGEPMMNSASTGRDEKLFVPKPLRNRYAALGLTSRDIIIRMLAFPANTRGSIEDRIRSQMNIGKDYRVAWELQQEVPNKTEGTDREYLVVAIPDRDARRALGLVSQGSPFPASLEAAGVASLKAFENACLPYHTEDCVALLDAGTSGMLLSLFVRGQLSLVKTFTFGESALVRTVQRRLGISAEEARGIILDRSFNILETAHEVLRPFVEQLKRSAQYVQHKNNLAPTCIYLSGGFSYSPFLVSVIETSTDLETRYWNPFDRLHIESGAIPEYVTGMEGRFAVAVGAALNNLGAAK